MFIEIAATVVGITILCIGYQALQLVLRVIDHEVVRRVRK